VKFIRIGFVAALMLTGLVQSAWAAGEVNIYSARNEVLIKPLLDRFTAETGIVVNLVTGNAGALMKRLESEGVNTPADLFLTVDVGRLHAAKAAGLFQPVTSELLESRIPQHLRDKDQNWFALSARSRVIIYSRDRVDPARLSTYEALTDLQWLGKICIRSSNNIYNQSLLASMIANDGPQAAETWASGIVANMARKPKGNDRGQISAVAAGECDIAIANTYYLGKMQTSDKEDGQRRAAEKVAVFFPNQSGRGAHMNVSGAGVIKYAKNRDNAVRLLEFLVSDESQNWYAQANHEYPVVEGVSVSDIVAAWGYPFKSDALNITVLGLYNAEAVRIFDRAGWK
jgi:iron(III) transport system substrate-binding protein